MIGDAGLIVVVGAGGVGKTTLAAALALDHAHAGHRTLVMTFDPSRRLKDSLGVGDAALGTEVAVPVEAAGQLSASLLDPRATFDRLVTRYAPDRAAAERILTNRFYAHLRGTLAGVLEYMAVERLFEVVEEGAYDRIVLDTPPTRQALDFLGAPDRIVSFLDSGALKVGLRPWFDQDGRLRVTRRFGPLGRGVERFFDRVVGLGLLRDMAEFFLAFEPLYAGFRSRALDVQRLLRASGTRFLLVTRPEAERVPEAMFFARTLTERGHHLGPVLVNQCHPRAAAPPAAAIRDSAGWQLMAWLGERDARGLAVFRSRLGSHPVATLPLLPDEPADLTGLETVRGHLVAALADTGAPAVRRP